MTPDPTQTLTTLHALHPEWVAAGLPEVWPEYVIESPYGDDGWCYGGSAFGESCERMDPPDALAIVEKRWEEALVERGWAFHCPGSASEKGYDHKSDGYAHEYEDLIAAIRAEIGRKMEEAR